MQRISADCSCMVTLRRTKDLNIRYSLRKEQRPRNQGYETAASGVELVTQVSPVLSKHNRRQDKTENNIDHYTRCKCQEWFTTSVFQLAETRGQPDTEKAEDKGPGPQILDWAYHCRDYGLLEVGLTIVCGDKRHNDGSQHEADDEFRETPPDLGRIRFRPGLALPTGGGNYGQDKRPDTNPHIAAHHLHQGKRVDSVTRIAGDTWRICVTVIGIG